MITRCVLGICMVALLSAPVLGGGGNPDGGVKLSMFVEPGSSAPRHREAAPQPKAKVKDNLDYYDIDGNTAAQLRAQMKRNGTRWSDGKIYAALTTWDIRYRYDIKKVDGKYVLENIATYVDVDIHMPKLAASAKTIEPLLASWKEYEKNLKTHEMGHRDIAVAIGDELSQGLAALGSCDSKSELDGRARALVKDKFKKLKEEQVAYDEATHHGKLQGAVLRDPALATAVPAQDDDGDGQDES